MRQGLCEFPVPVNDENKLEPSPSPSGAEYAKNPGLYRRLFYSEECAQLRVAEALSG